MNRYRLSPHVYLECFEDDAVLLIAEKDYMITLNHAGAQLFKQAQETLGHRLFSRSDCVHLLLENYELSTSEAEEKMRSMIGFGLMQHIVLKQ